MGVGYVPLNLSLLFWVYASFSRCFYYYYTLHVPCFQQLWSPLICFPRTGVSTPPNICCFLWVFPNKLRRYPQQQRFLVLAAPRSPRRTSWNPRGTLPQGRPGSPRSLSGLRPQNFQLLGKKELLQGGTGSRSRGF